MMNNAVQKSVGVTESQERGGQGHVYSNRWKLLGRWLFPGFLSSMVEAGACGPECRHQCQCELHSHHLSMLQRKMSGLLTMQFIDIRMIFHGKPSEASKAPSLLCLSH